MEQTRIKQAMEKAGETIDAETHTHQKTHKIMYKQKQEGLKT